MVTQAQHRMERVGAHDTGAEEWACPACGRRLLLHAQPALGTAVLAAGDAWAAHYGGLSSGMARPSTADHGHTSGGAGADGEIPFEILRPWLNALKAIEDEGLVL